MRPHLIGTKVRYGIRYRILQIRRNGKGKGCFRMHLAAEPEAQFLMAEAFRPHYAKLYKLGFVTAASQRVPHIITSSSCTPNGHIRDLRAVER